MRASSDGERTLRAEDGSAWSPAESTKRRQAPRKPRAVRTGQSANCQLLRRGQCAHPQDCGRMVRNTDRGRSPRCRGRPYEWRVIRAEQRRLGPQADMTRPISKSDECERNSFRGIEDLTTGMEFPSSPRTSQASHRFQADRARASGSTRPRFATHSRGTREQIPHGSRVGMDLSNPNPK